MLEHDTHPKKDQSNIKCFNADQKYLAKGLHIGALFYQLDKCNDPIRQNELEMDLGKQLLSVSGQDLNAVVSRINEFSLSMHGILDSSTSESILALMHNLIQKKPWASKLSAESIILIGQDELFVRESIIALIRNSIESNDDKNIFDSFDFERLSAASVRQNSLYVNSFISKINTLPIADLINLGRQNTHIAKIILSDIDGHVDSIKVGASFYAVHANLRESIQSEWKRRIEGMGFNEDIVSEIKREAGNLEQKHPELSEISLLNRISRQNNLEPEGRASVRRWLDYIVPPLAITATGGAIAGELTANISAIYGLTVGLAYGASPACTAILWSTATCTAAATAIPISIAIAGGASIVGGYKMLRK
jgi:hypothetical protein